MLRSFNDKVMCNTIITCSRKCHAENLHTSLYNFLKLKKNGKGTSRICRNRSLHQPQRLTHFFVGERGGGGGGYGRVISGTIKKHEEFTLQ